MRTLILLLLLAGMLLAGAPAGAVTVIAADVPPYVIRASQGGPSGMAIEVLEEAARRLHEPLEIVVMPLARALNEARYHKHVLLLPPVRSTEREHRYHWIAPLLDEAYLVVSNRQRHPAPIKVKDLPGLHIGTLRHSFGQHLIKQRLGLATETVADETYNAQKLIRGRIQAWVAGWNTIYCAQHKAGLAMDQLVRGETLMRTQLFLAASKDFPLPEADRWRNMLLTMQQDGSLARILQRYDYQAP